MCLHPIKAELQTFGRPKFTHEGSLQLPCGKCAECISLRAVEWATRASHEISLHKHNSFITLTYNDDKLPSHLVLKEPFQLFIKRLRKKLKQNIRYMVSHEYGSQYFRPHHHAIIFGWNPEKQYEPRTTKSGEKIFRSHELEKLWTNGFSSVGTANERSAYYIASYALKGKKHEIVLPNGEFTHVSDQFDCSRRPAIGLHYLIKNQQQLFNSGVPLPRYYLKKLETINPELFEEIQNNQLFKIKNRTNYEIYAKHIIQKYKSSLDNEFRSTPEITKEETLREQHLKYNRELEAHHTKEN